MQAQAISAPAKIILFGEHAVVYGKPAIAAPVSAVRAYASFAPNPEGERGLRVVARDLGDALPRAINPEAVDDAIALTARLTLDALDAQPPNVTITIQSDIPIASGLGSGSAVATALARAICAAVERDLPLATLNHIIYESEKIHHGTPSGIDNTVIVFEQPIYFVREQPIQPITFGVPLDLLIADTGISASTRVAIADVRAFYDRDRDHAGRLIDSIGALVRGARFALNIGDLEQVGGLMVENHALLRELTVSSPELDRLVDAALSVGALGAKLSGGGRGGNMIALVTPDTRAAVEAALTNAGAARLLHTEIA